MRPLRSLLAATKPAVAAAAVWFLLESSAGAQTAATAPEGSWPFTGSYAITVLLVTLGMLVVCQGGRRVDEPPLASRFEEN
jgi:hypothetical protein